MIWTFLMSLALAAPQRLGLNAATADELVASAGLAASDAQRVVALRTQRGRLQSVEELRVLGLGDATLDALRKSTDVEVTLQLASARSFTTPEEVLAHFASEPTIQDVQQWTSHYAGTDPETVARWLRASRSFAALPQLTLEYGYDDGFDQDFVYLTVDGNTVETPNDELFPGLEGGGRDQSMDFLVRTRWDLNELVMSSERIRVISEAQDVVKLRDKMLGEVTRTYFERRRLQVEGLLQPRADLLGQLKDQLRLMELTANLDAMTGGAFSTAMAR